MFGTTTSAAGIQAYMCPGRGRPIVTTATAGPWTDYFINPYLNINSGAVSSVDSKRTMVGITDGSSNTIMVGHGQIRQGEYSLATGVTGSTSIFLGGLVGTARSNGASLQVNARDPVGVTGSPQTSWGGPFAQGAAMCLGDATTRFFPYTVYNVGRVTTAGVGGTVPTALSVFLTPNGSETSTLPD